MRGKEEGGIDGKRGWRRGRGIKGKGERMEKETFLSGT